MVNDQKVCRQKLYDRHAEDGCLRIMGVSAFTRFVSEQLRMLQDVLGQFHDIITGLNEVCFMKDDDDEQSILEICQIIDDIMSVYKQLMAFKNLQRTKTPEEKIVEEYQNLAALLISKAEEYVKAMEEVWNGSLSYEEMKKMFREWSRDVNALYFKITDADPAPVERIKWAESILELAGLVSDLTLYIGRNEHKEYAEERWVISHVIRRYHDALDELKRIYDVPKFFVIQHDSVI